MGHYTCSGLLPQEALVMLAIEEKTYAVANMQICRLMYVSWQRQNDVETE